MASFLKLKNAFFADIEFLWTWEKSPIVNFKEKGEQWGSRGILKIQSVRVLYSGLINKYLRRERVQLHLVCITSAIDIQHNNITEDR